MPVNRSRTWRKSAAPRTSLARTSLARTASTFAWTTTTVGRAASTLTRSPPTFTATAAATALATSTVLTAPASGTPTSLALPFAPPARRRTWIWLPSPAVLPTFAEATRGQCPDADGHETCADDSQESQQETAAIHNASIACEHERSGSAQPGM